MRYDLTGQRFGKLYVKRFAGVHTTPNGSRRTMWECVCDCGNTAIISTSSIRHQKTISCGCVRVERVTSHGLSHTRLYQTWADMKSRCYNPNNNGYHRYGGRGIKVCDEWQTFPPFAEWALNNGYDPSLTIERINNDGNYEPSNCCWATQSQQASNKSTTHQVTIGGETHCLTHWARIAGLTKAAVLYRYRAGKRGEDLLAPLQKRTVAK